MYQLKNLLFAVVSLDVLLLALLVYLLIRQYSLIKTARLILENQLLHTPIAKTEDGEGGEIDFYFSGFGMLLGDMVIPFNVGDRKLDSLLIDKEETIISYGTESEKKTVRILKTLMTEEQLEDFRKKLYHETGVVASVHRR